MCSDDDDGDDNVFGRGLDIVCFVVFFYVDLFFRNSTMITVI